MTPSPLLQLLTERLRDAPFHIGQIAVSPLTGDGIELRHRDDAGLAADGLETFDRPDDARDIAQYDAAGEYRPLKGSPDLKRGWRLVLAGPGEVRTALDLFYPAALALWAACSGNRMRVVPLATTLERQTGMYRFARNISPEGAADLMRRRCLTGCSRHPLWAESPNPEIPSHGIPLLCPEACSFFVAEARVVAKAEFDAKAAPQPASEN